MKESVRVTTSMAYNLDNPLDKNRLHLCPFEGVQQPKKNDRPSGGTAAADRWQIALGSETAWLTHRIC